MRFPLRLPRSNGINKSFVHIYTLCCKPPRVGNKYSSKSNQSWAVVRKILLEEVCYIVTCILLYIDIYIIYTFHYNLFNRVCPINFKQSLQQPPTETVTTTIVCHWAHRERIIIFRCGYIIEKHTKYSTDLFWWKYIEKNWVMYQVMYLHKKEYTGTTQGTVQPTYIDRTPSKHVLKRPGVPDLFRLRIFERHPVYLDIQIWLI